MAFKAFNGTSWHMEHVLPKGTTDLRIMWGARGESSYVYDCLLSIRDAAGTQLYSETYSGPSDGQVPSGLESTTTVSIIELGSALASTDGIIKFGWKRSRPNTRRVSFGYTQNITEVVRANTRTTGSGSRTGI